jgi:hypothetical protein
MKKFVCPPFLLLLLLSRAWGQSPFVPLNADYYHLVDRLEIRQGRWAEGFHSTTKAYNRQSIVQLTDSVLTNTNYRLSETDRFNLGYLRDDSWEWVKYLSDSIPQDPISRFRPAQFQPGDNPKPLWNVFFKKKADFYAVKTPEFDLHISPAINIGWDSDPAATGAQYVNTRGLELRGSIMKRLGFYTYFADNQVFYPRYIQEYGNVYRSPQTGGGFAPGEGLTKLYKERGADFLSARGYVTFNALKIINIQFGHDRNFFGNGIRSLFLSDNSAAYSFLKFTTRFGRFQYTNLFTELQNVADVQPGNALIPQKFMVVHHLSANISKHVNVGVFEGEIYSRDRFEASYLNPIILYRYIESYRGSEDNAVLGIDVKANFLRHFLFYGQIMLDEFLIKNLTDGKGSWTNKFAIQAGLKYIDAFGIKNLDLQGEVNLARPYTYAHKSGQTNYTHYNQPLAHPLGANFMEGIGTVRYQHKRLFFTGIFSTMLYGTDPPGFDYGGNLTKNYEARFRDVGNFIGQGRKTITTYADARLSYMIWHNVFLEGRYLYRLQSSQYRASEYTTNLASVGLRWNIANRNWIF